MYLCGSACEPTLSHRHAHARARVRTHTRIVYANKIEIILLQASGGAKAWALESDGVYILAILIASHITLTKVLNLFRPQFLHPQKEGESACSLVVFGLDETMHRKPSANCNPSVDSNNNNIVHLVGA